MSLVEFIIFNLDITSSNMIPMSLIMSPYFYGVISTTYICMHDLITVVFQGN